MDLVIYVTITHAIQLFNALVIGGLSAIVSSFLYKKPKKIMDFARLDPETRLIIIGDASMAPYELMAHDGSIHITERSGRPSIDQLHFLADTFEHSVWLNPVAENMWGYTHTIGAISKIFPMFELSIDGLEQAVKRAPTRRSPPKPTWRPIAGSCACSA